MSTAKSTDFRLYLQDELIRRCRKNPRYSIRAFAKSLDVDFSTLSKLMNGKRKMGDRVAKKLAGKLGLSPSEFKRFFEVTPARDDYFQHSQDTFSIISDWYHYALLELLRVDGFEPGVKAVARTLGVNLHEAQSAVDRLIRVGILEITPSGAWIDRSGGRSTNISALEMTSARKTLQRQILEQALAAIDNTPAVDKDQTSMTMAIDTRKLPEARDLITKFRRDLAKFLSRDLRRDEVYQLSISLFPVSQLVSRPKTKNT